MKKVFIALGILLCICILGGSIKAKYLKLKEDSGDIESKIVYLDQRLERHASLAGELVRAFRKHSNKDVNLVNDVIIARQNLLKSNGVKEKAEENENLNNAINRLLEVTDNYPKLQKDVEFNNLRKEIELIEEDINNNKKEYNDAVKDYNDRINSGTTNVLAIMLDYSEKVYFE